MSGRRELRRMIEPSSVRVLPSGGDLAAPVLEAMRDYVALGDEDPVRVALAVGATVELPGQPLWVMLVGGPSSGKSETIDVVRDAIDGRIKALTGPGLLSWKAGKKPRPTGLLARLGDGDKFATIGDLSNLLAKSERGGGRDDAFALLRDAYDGAVIRDLGTAPEPLVWEGRLTLLAASTPAIDHYSSHQDALGPRWAYLRLAELEDNADAASLAYGKLTEKGDAQIDARERAAIAIDLARQRIDPRAGSSGGRDRIIAAARLAARMRSVVPRESTGPRDVMGAPIIEEPMRLVGQARALYIGLLAIGADDDNAVRVACRLALDCCPPVRRALLGELARTGELVGLSELARRAGAHRHVAGRALEDMEVLRLTTEITTGSGQTSARGWVLHHDAIELAKAALT